MFDGFFTLSELGTGSGGSVGRPDFRHRYAAGWPGGQATLALASGFSVQELPESPACAAVREFSRPPLPSAKPRRSRAACSQHVAGRPPIPRHRHRAACARPVRPTAGDHARPLRHSRALLFHRAAGVPSGHQLYFRGSVNAALGGWDHAALVTLLRMPVSGVGATPEGDRFDFALRAQLPGKGLSFSKPVSRSQWHARSLDPATGREARSGAGRTSWSAAGLLIGSARRRRPARTGGPPYTRPGGRLALHRCRPRRFRRSVGEAASVLGTEKISLAQFWKQVETTLALEPFESRTAAAMWFT